MFLSEGYTAIPLYVEVDALGHANSTWGMMSKAIGMGNADGVKCDRRY